MIDWYKLLIEHSERPFTRGLMLEPLETGSIHVYAWRNNGYTHVTTLKDPSAYAMIALCAHFNRYNTVYYSCTHVALHGFLSLRVTNRFREFQPKIQDKVTLTVTGDVEASEFIEWFTGNFERYYPGYFDKCKYKPAPGGMVVFEASDEFCAARLLDALCVASNITWRCARTPRVVKILD